MRIILQSMDRFVELGEFDTRTNNISTFTKGVEKVPTFGSYSRYEDDILAIYADGLGLFAVWGTHKIRVGPNTSAKVEEESNVRTLKVYDCEREIFSYAYSPNKGIDGDMTPFHEAEDDDYFLFMAKIINSPDRQAVILERSNALLS